MKRALAGVMMAVLGLATVPAPAGQKAQLTGAEKLGWKLTLQSWTLQTWNEKKKTVFDALDVCKELGIKYIETFPTQPISPTDDTKFGPGTTDAQIQAVLDKAKACGVKLIDCGVINIPNNDNEARKVFEWARKVGITILVAEPDPKALPLIDKLAGEFKMKVGLHDHAKPSTYWDPEFVDVVTRDLKNVGYCADVGHWKRSGLDPVAVLKKHGDRVVSVHFKDLKQSEATNKFKDVVWGMGECGAAAMLAALKDKGFRGPIAIEWESPWDLPTLRKCIDFFNVQADMLAAK